MNYGTEIQLQELANITRSEIHQRVEAYRIDKLEERTGVRCGMARWGLLRGIAIQSDVVLREVIPQTFTNLQRSIRASAGGGEGGEQSALRNIREWRRFFEEEEIAPWEIAVRELEAVLTLPGAFAAPPEGQPCPTGRHPQTAGCLCGVDTEELEDVPYSKEPEDIATIRLQLLQGGRR